jgi:cysteine-S-conjugate beta-lyase
MILLLSLSFYQPQLHYATWVEKNSKPVAVPPLSSLQLRKSEKWRAYPAEILPMPFAVMDFELSEPIKKSLIDLVNNSDAGYLGKIPELGQSLTNFSANRWNWKIAPEDIKICPDVGVGVIEVCRQIVKPDDQIMINTPVYYNFFNWIKELNCKPYDAPLIENQLTYSLDFEKIAEGYASGVKVHILCNPHNPVGAVFSQLDLAKLADLAGEFGVVIASDEIHAPLTYKEKSFTPFLNSSAVAKEVGISFLSATKSWSIAGLKCAQIVAVGEKTRQIVAGIPTAVHSRASLFGAVASAAAYGESIDWLDSVVAQLDQSRTYLGGLLSELQFDIGYREPDGGYFGWLDLRSVDKFKNLNSREDIAELLLTHGKIAVAPGHLYGPSGTGFIRINFATSFEIIEESVKRIKSTLEMI